MTRGKKKRLLRQATQMRIRAERDVLKEYRPPFDCNRVRTEERFGITVLQTVPSVFAFAEQMNPKYDRPLWASHRYGAR
jgi:hypothetical protein